MGTHFEWIADPVSVWVPGYKNWVVTLKQVAAQVIDSRRGEIAEWMKDNAPFKDVTGFARSTLQTTLEVELSYLMLTFHYSIVVYYARYLEYDHQGKYAILEPALNYWGPILMADLRAALGGF